MDMTIVIDTREQNPLPIKTDAHVKTITNTLSVGDYSLLGHETKIAIERKSLTDLFGTLGKGHKRFRRELERAKKYNYFAIVIEGDYDRILEKSFDGAKFSKIRGDVIAQILFTLNIKYGINIFFCQDRYQATRIVKEIFKSYLKNWEGIKMENENQKQEVIQQSSISFRPRGTGSDCTIRFFDKKDMDEKIEIVFEGLRTIQNHIKTLMDRE